jgi:hypothetical protein
MFSEVRSVADGLEQVQNFNDWCTKQDATFYD